MVYQARPWRRDCERRASVSPGLDSEVSGGRHGHMVERDDMTTRPNPASVVDAPVASLFVSVRCKRRATDQRRSATSMTPRTKFILTILIMGTLGFFGCSKKEAGGPQQPKFSEVAGDDGARFERQRRIVAAAAKQHYR